MHAKPGLSHSRRSRPARYFVPKFAAAIFTNQFQAAIADAPAALGIGLSHARHANYLSAAPAEDRRGYRAYYQSGQRQPDWFKRYVSSDAEFRRTVSATNLFSLVGAIEAQSGLQQVLPNCPSDFCRMVFVFATEITDGDDLLFLFYPNPRNPTQLLTV
jgi:hypothetical protein